MTECFVCSLPSGPEGEEVVEFLKNQLITYRISSDMGRLTRFLLSNEESSDERADEGFKFDSTVSCTPREGGSIKPQVGGNDRNAQFKPAGNDSFTIRDKMIDFLITPLPSGTTGDELKRFLSGNSLPYLVSSKIDEIASFMQKLEDTSAKRFAPGNTINFEPEDIGRTKRLMAGRDLHAKRNEINQFGIQGTSSRVSQVPVVVKGSTFTPNFSLQQPEPRPLNAAVLLSENYGATGGASIMLSSGTPILAHVVKEEQEHANPLFSDALVKEEIQEDCPFFEQNPHTLFPLGTSTGALMMHEEAVEFGRHDSGDIEMTELERAPSGKDNSSMCPVCKATFTSFYALIGHLHSHKGKNYFPCTTCGKFLSSSESLRIHMLIHTEDFPYRCDVCEKRFRQDAQRRQHMRYHTGEQFKCPECQNTYGYSGTLSQHRHRVHGIPKGPRGRPRQVKE